MPWLQDEGEGLPGVSEWGLRGGGAGVGGGGLAVGPQGSLELQRGGEIGERLRTEMLLLLLLLLMIEMLRLLVLLLVIEMLLLLLCKRLLVLVHLLREVRTVQQQGENAPRGKTKGPSTPRTVTVNHDDNDNDAIIRTESDPNDIVRHHRHYRGVDSTIRLS